MHFFLIIMKTFSRTFLALIVTILLQGCSKTYEFQFENLSMLAFEENFKTPKYHTDCRMVVKTSEEFDVEQYIENASNISNFLYDFEWDDSYSYMKEWDKTKSGFFYFPNVKNWTITLYENATGEKFFEASCSDGVVEYLSVWESGKLICEAKGCIMNYGEVYVNYLSSGNLKIYDYENDEKQYIKKEESIECIEETEEYSKFKQTISENYPTGKAYHIISKIYTDDDSYYETICDSYYNEDGSEMTKFDRLTMGDKDYTLFKTNFSSYGKPIYAVMIPYPHSRKSGYIATFSSSDKRFNEVSMKNHFNYDVNGDVLECSNYFGYSFGVPTKSTNGVRFFFDIEEVEDEIALVARTPRNHFFDDFELYAMDEPYNSVLYDFLKEEIGWQRSSSSTSSKQDESNKPGWLIASWRTPLNGGGALIVNLYPKDADVRIMNGFTLVSKMEYDNWTVLDNMLYLINDGERVADSPSFYVDFNNRSILGHNGERFQKH